MFGFLILFSIAYLCTYNVLKKKGSKEALKVATASFLAALGLTVLLFLVIIPFLRNLSE